MLYTSTPHIGNMGQSHTYRETENHVLGGPAGDDLLKVVNMKYGQGASQLVEDTMAYNRERALVDSDTQMDPMFLYGNFQEKESKEMTEARKKDDPDSLKRKGALQAMEGRRSGSGTISSGGRSAQRMAYFSVNEQDPDGPVGSGIQGGSRVARLL